MSTYQFNTLFQVNVMCIHFYVFDCPLLALSTSSMNISERLLSSESGRSTSDVELVISVKASLLYLSKIIFLVMD